MVSVPETVAVPNFHSKVALVGAPVVTKVMRAGAQAVVTFAVKSIPEHCACASLGTSHRNNRQIVSVNILTENLMI